MCRILFVCVMSLVALVSVGCGGGGGEAQGGEDSPYVGQWTIDKEAMKGETEAALREQLKGLKEDLIEQQIQAARQAIEQSQSSMWIHAGGTYSLATSVGMQGATRNGTWAPDGKSIVLTTPGQPDVKARIKDGKLLIENKTGEGPAHTVLVRTKA